MIFARPQTDEHPAGYRRKADPFDDEPSLDPSIANDLEPLFEDGEDDNPGDRRRDPLRK